MARGAAFTTSLAVHAAALALVVLVPFFGPETLPDAERHTPPLQLWPAAPSVVRADSRPAVRPAIPGPPRPVVAPEAAAETPALAPTLSLEAESQDLSQGPPAGFGEGLGTGTEPGGGGDGDLPGASPGAGSGSTAGGGEPRRVGGDLQPPAKVLHVRPEYPPLARVARVRGTVVLECTIDPAGNVIDVRVLSGHPLLAPAAALAVGRWRYSPTRLNGQPVSVLLTVTVRFDLAP